MGADQVYSLETGSKRPQSRYYDHFIFVELSRYFKGLHCNASKRRLTEKDKENKKEQNSNRQESKRMFEGSSETTDGLYFLGCGGRAVVKKWLKGSPLKWIEKRARVLQLSACAVASTCGLCFVEFNSFLQPRPAVAREREREKSDGLMPPPPLLLLLPHPFFKPMMMMMVMMMVMTTMMKKWRGKRWPSTPPLPSDQVAPLT